MLLLYLNTINKSRIISTRFFLSSFSPWPKYIDYFLVNLKSKKLMWIEKWPIIFSFIVTILCFIFIFYYFYFIWKEMMVDARYKCTKPRYQNNLCHEFHIVISNKLISIWDGDYWRSLMQGQLYFYPKQYYRRIHR